MKHAILKWTAYLSNGAVLDQTMKENDIIPWPTEHWAQEDNRLQQIQMEVVEENSFTTGKILLKLKDIPFMEMMAFCENDALQLFVKPEQKPDAILAFYMYNDWWTRPAFCKSLQEIPERTNLILTQAGDSYTGYLALPGKEFKARFTAGSRDDVFSVILSAYHSGYAQIQEDAFLAVTDADPYRCLEKLMKEAASRAGIADRDQRKFPDMFEKIGWCSWDAFYKDITEEKVIEKMKEIREKDIPFGWILLDDGWLDIKNERLRKMSADSEKFPGNLISAVGKIKELTEIEKVGVWHAFSGYWGGIEPGSDIEEQEKENLIATVHGKVLPAPKKEKAYQFFADWYRYLSEQGISFVKVDSQSTMITHYKGNVPIGKSAVQLHQGLDQAAADFMNGNLINCMGMGVENVLARPFSPISRNSDDFFPQRDNGFEEHLLQNAYNSLYHTWLYHGDWDMFWSSHPDAGKHAIIRALSGGPVYVSDRIGESESTVLARLCYKDGTILRTCDPAVPTRDCLFQNPSKSGYLKIKNECNGVHYLAIFNYSDEDVQVPYQVTDVLDEKQERGDSTQKYAVYGRCRHTCEIVTASEVKNCVLEKKGYELYLITPVCQEVAVFGLIDKYLSSHGVECVSYDGDTLNIQMKECGEVLAYFGSAPGNIKINGTTAEVIHTCENGFLVLATTVTSKERRTKQ